MSNTLELSENELDKIFNEKLQIEKNNPLSDKSNKQYKNIPHAINYDILQNQPNPISYLNKEDNFPLEEDVNPSVLSSTSANIFPYRKEEDEFLQFRSPTLEGLYEDEDLRDVNETKKVILNQKMERDEYGYKELHQKLNVDNLNIQDTLKTKETLHSSNFSHPASTSFYKNAITGLNEESVQKRVTFADDIQELDRDNGGKGGPTVRLNNYEDPIQAKYKEQDNNLKIEEQVIDFKDKRDEDLLKQETSFKDGINTDKLKKLEKEFNLLIRTQRDTLKMKSKIHRFVFSEIHAIRKEFSERVEALEKENATLKQENTELHSKLKQFNNNLEKYKREVKNQVCLWKEAVEQRIRDYLQNRQKQTK